jgi:hypothetical protein
MNRKWRLCRAQWRAAVTQPQESTTVQSWLAETPAKHSSG